MSYRNYDPNNPGLPVAWQGWHYGAPAYWTRIHRTAVPTKDPELALLGCGRFAPAEDEVAELLIGVAAEAHHAPRCKACWGIPYAYKKRPGRPKLRLIVGRKAA